MAFNQTTPTTPTTPATPVTYITLGKNIQSGLNATHINWIDIDWSLYTNRPGMPEYAVTHDLNSVSVFVPRAAASTPTYLQATDENGNPLTKTVTTGGSLEDTEIVVRDKSGNALQEYVIVDLFGNVMSDAQLAQLSQYQLIDVKAYKYNADNSELITITEKVLANNLGKIITPDNFSTIGNYTITEVPFYLRDANGEVVRGSDGSGKLVPIQITNDLGVQQKEFVLLDPFGRVMSNADAVALGFKTADIRMFSSVPQTDGTLVMDPITETVLTKPNGSFWSSSDTPFVPVNLTMKRVDFVVRDINTGEKLTEPRVVGGVTSIEPVLKLDQYGNPIRIVDYTKDLFLAIGGTDGNDHLRNKDYSFPNGTGQQTKLTGALMGFSGNDVLYSENIYTPMLMGGTGDDTYIIDSVSSNTGTTPADTSDGGGDTSTATAKSKFVQIVEQGGDDNDSIISYYNDWAHAADIDGRHLILTNKAQSDILLIWDYKSPKAKIENFWFDFDHDGINEHYNFDEFVAKIKSNNFWIGSLNSEALGVSTTTMNDLTQKISEAVTLSMQIENHRIAKKGTVLEIARLYQAAFDRKPDKDGLNYWVDQWEAKNLSLSRIADAFYSSTEFTSTYGNLDTKQYITQLYANVLDRTPDQAGMEFWTNAINNGASESSILLEFSDSLENKVNTQLQLSGLAETTPGDWIL